MTNLNEGIKTGLYQFFNKNYKISNNKVFFKINNSPVRLNMDEKYNCIYLLQTNELKHIEPPFLSRFQKFKFNLEQYRR